MDTDVEKDDADVSSLQSQLSEACITWRQEMELHDSQVEKLNEKLHEMKTIIHHSQDMAKHELDFLWRRVRTTATLLAYLKSKASSDWSKNAQAASFENLNDEELIKGTQSPASLVDLILKSVQLVKDVMESLATRVIVAENKVVVEKEKVSAGKEEIRKKSLQIEVMAAKVHEMEKFALGTSTILNEMRQKVEDMVEETSRQRLRAVENEQELSRVKQDFESLKSYVCGLVGVRETLISSEETHSTENILGTLIDRATRLQSEKSQKESEVENLIAENVRLNALLDKKEAQLLALNEQCKFMALRNLDS